MAYLTKTRLKDETSNQYLESIGMTNIDSISLASVWAINGLRFSFSPLVKITNVQMLIYYLYCFSFDEGFKRGKEREFARVTDALIQTLKESKNEN